MREERVTAGGGVELAVRIWPAPAAGLEKEAALARAVSALPDGRVHWFWPADHDVHAQHPVDVATVLHDALTALG